MKCTLCGSPLINKLEEQYYDCVTCKAIVKDEAFFLSPKEERARYETHNNDVDDVRYQNFTMPITNHVLEHFLPHHKGLDFGSGTGPVISSMLGKQGYSIVQYDPFFAPDKSLLNNHYDYIVSCEVFEHFYNPKTEIDQLVSILNTNGMLLIMTDVYNDQIDFSTWYYRNDPTHVFIYRRETIEYIARQNKLEVDVLTDRLVVFRKPA